MVQCLQTNFHRKQMLMWLFLDQSLHRNHFGKRWRWGVQVLPCWGRPFTSNFASPGCGTEFSTCCNIARRKVSLTFIHKNWESGTQYGLFTSWKGTYVIQWWSSGLSYIKNETQQVREYLTIIPWARVGYEMVNSQQGA